MSRFPSTSLLSAEAESYPYHDAFRAGIGDHLPSSQMLIRAFFASFPGWAAALMRLRNAMTRRLGLKSDNPPLFLTTPFEVGQEIGVFRLLTITPHEVIIGQNDRHLDFRLSLHVIPSTTGTDLEVGSLVKPHNRLGWSYLMLVLPFHLLIAATMVRRMARFLHENRDSDSPAIPDQQERSF